MNLTRPQDDTHLCQKLLRDLSLCALSGSPQTSSFVQRPQDYKLESSTQDLGTRTLLELFDRPCELFVGHFFFIRHRIVVDLDIHTKNPATMALKEAKEEIVHRIKNHESSGLPIWESE